jgi:hypothetical protein
MDVSEQLSAFDPRVIKKYFLGIFLDFSWTSMKVEGAS